MNADTDSAKTYTPINPTSRAGGKAQFRGTARKDTTKRILRNGWVDGCICDGRYTDDYKLDLANDFDRGSVDPEDVIDAMERVSPKRVWIDLRSDGRQILTLYWGFQTYVVELDTRKVRFDFEEVDEDDV